MRAELPGEAPPQRGLTCTEALAAVQARADALAVQLEASRAQAASADAEAAETEASFHLLQAEARARDAITCTRMHVTSPCHVAGWARARSCLLAC